jgi:ribulose-5-phosphate 4-epimerase/fuculose-1-phosphate aldolase
MTEASERIGGLAAWAPHRVPPRGVVLSPHQELACAVRHLDITGFSENMTGHVSWQQPGHDTLLVNPWGYWWREVRAADVLEVDLGGSVLVGPWDVTPAIHIHTELHRRRPDARVVVHSHPIHASVLAAVPELPEIVHQNSSILDGEMVLVNDYDGEVDSPVLGAALADAIGEASVALLVSHGVIVTAPTMAEAIYKSVLFERTCEMHLRLRAIGAAATPIAAPFRKQLKASLIERAAPVYWDGAIRRLVADEPEVLEKGP